MVDAAVEGGEGERGCAQVEEECEHEWLALYGLVLWLVEFCWVKQTT